MASVHSAADRSKASRCGSKSAVSRALAPPKYRTAVGITEVDMGMPSFHDSSCVQNSMASLPAPTFTIQINLIIVTDDPVENLQLVE
jgi:hypothetical protein